MNTKEFLTQREKLILKHDKRRERNQLVSLGEIAQIALDIRRLAFELTEKMNLANYSPTREDVDSLRNELECLSENIGYL